MPGEDEDGDADEDSTPCYVCDEPIEPQPNRRVRTWIEDGLVHYRQYCSPECYQADEHPDRS